MDIYDIKKENLRYNLKVDIDSKILEILSSYKSIILPYIKDITGKSTEDISEKDVYNYIIDMIYISTNGKYSKELLNEFSNLTQQEVKQKLVENIFIRETLNKKFGVRKDYNFFGNIGDHGICDSLDFSINDISHISSKQITDKQFNLISSEYINEILAVIKRKPNLNVYFVYNGKNYSNSQLIDNYNQFIKGNVELNMENKIILKEMINLISTYSLNELLNKKDEVKKEISLGVYDYIEMPNPKFSQSDREKLNRITNIWNINDIANYSNLPLLIERFGYIVENGKIRNVNNIANIIEQIKDVISNGIPDKEVDSGYTADELGIKMNDWYKYFEEVNREDILGSVYSSSKQNAEMTKKEEVPESMLVHFYNSNATLEKVFQLIAINRARKEHGEKPIVIKSLIGIYKDKEIQEQINKNLLRFKDYIETTNIEGAINELQPDISFKIKDSDEEIPRLNVLMAEQAQLACYLINKESLINLLNYDGRMTSGSGNVAFGVGFSKNGVKSENILLSCDSNANSNIGMENIPCEDPFVDLSKTYKELSEVKNKRTEVLIDRHDLKPNYLLILKGKNIDEYDNELIQTELKKAKDLGIASVIMDIGEIIRSEKEKSICNERQDR